MEGFGVVFLCRITETKDRLLCFIKKVYNQIDQRSILFGMLSIRFDLHLKQVRK
jgi:hypothetical protein